MTISVISVNSREVHLTCEFRYGFHICRGFECGCCLCHGFLGVCLFIYTFVGRDICGLGVVCGMRVMGWCVGFWVGVWFMVCGIIGYGLQHGGASFRVEERPAICGIA